MSGIYKETHLTKYVVQVYKSDTADAIELVLDSLNEASLISEVLRAEYHAVELWQRVTTDTILEDS